MNNKKPPSGNAVRGLERSSAKGASVMGRCWPEMLNWVPKQTLFGGLLHCWIYDPALLKPSRTTRSGWVLRDSPAAQAPDLAADPVWDLVKQISEVPLLDHWRDFVMSELRRDLLADLDDEACRPVGRIHPTFVRLPNDFSSRISSYVRDGRLTLLADA